MADSNDPPSVLPIRVKWFILGALFGIVVAGVFFFQEYLPRPWMRRLAIAGQVVRCESGRPVANARVVIAVSNQYGLLGFEEQHFGLIADDQGRFSLDVKTRIDIDSFRVMASAPDNQYAEISLGGYLRSTNSLELKTWALPCDLVKSLGAQYAHFLGRHPPIHGDQITFLGPGWDVGSSE